MRQRRLSLDVILFRRTYWVVERLWRTVPVNVYSGPAVISFLHYVMNGESRDAFDLDITRYTA